MNVSKLICSAAVIAALLMCANGASAQEAKAGLTDADNAYKMPDGVTTKDITFYSEHVACHGKLFLPKGFSETGSVPAVVLVGEWGVTSPSFEKYAAKLAGAGLVAMPIDYRGWGKSGAFVRLKDPTFTDDRLRFHPMTTKVVFKRGRLLPEYQIEDIRNAISFLQGEKGVNGQQIGVWASGESAGNVVSVAARNGVIKAAVLQTPVICGKDSVAAAADPKGADLEDAIRRARTGKSAEMSSASTGKKVINSETMLALAEFHPFRLVSIIPESVAVLIVPAEKDELVKNEEHGLAAAKELKGPNKVTVLSGATHYAAYVGDAFEKGATAAVDWFKEHLK